VRYRNPFKKKSLKLPNLFKPGLQEEKADTLSILNDDGTWSQHRIKHPTRLTRFWWWITRKKNWRTTITLTEPIRSRDDQRS